MGASGSRGPYLRGVSRHAGGQHDGRQAGSRHPGNSKSGGPPKMVCLDVDSRAYERKRRSVSFPVSIVGCMLRLSIIVGTSQEVDRWDAGPGERPPDPAKLPVSICQRCRLAEDRLKPRVRADASLRRSIRASTRRLVSVGTLTLRTAASANNTRDRWDPQRLSRAVIIYTGLPARTAAIDNSRHEVAQITTALTSSGATARVGVKGAEKEWRSAALCPGSGSALAASVAPFSRERTNAPSTDRAAPDDRPLDCWFSVSSRLPRTPLFETR